MKNKYENIEMIDFDDKFDDIIDAYIQKTKNTRKLVGIIVNKEFAEYVMEEFMRFSWTSIKEIDLVDYMDIDEYLFYVDNDGNITCVPIEYFGVLDKLDTFYIDMDGDIKQSVINHCINEDKEVILFGQKDDDCDGGCENCACNELSDDEDGNTHGFMVSKSDGDSYVSYSYYTSEDLSQDDIEKMLKAFRF